MDLGEHSVARRRRLRSAVALAMFAMSAGCLEPTPAFGQDLPGPTPGCSNAVVDETEYCPGAERQVLQGSESPTLSIARLQREVQLDVVVGHAGSGVTLYTNIGGAFPTAIPLLEDGNVRTVDFVDTDTDGLVDIVVTIQDSDPEDPMAPTEDRLVVLRQVSPAPIIYANFQTVMIPAGPRHTIATDLDGNGQPDLVVACETAGVIAVLTANPDGTLAPPVTHPAGVGPRRVAASDLDGDGRQDLAVVPFGPQQLGVWLQTETGLVQGDTVAVGPGPSVVAFADVDADDAADLVVGHEGAPELWVFLAGGVQTLGRFGPPVISPTTGPVLDLTTRDLDGDGAVDILTAQGDTATIGRLTGVGDGSLTAGAIEATGSIQAVRSADANHDLMADIVVAKTGPQGGLSVLLADP